MGSINFTGATNTPTFTTSTAASVFGSITLISGMTLTNSSQTYIFEGRNYNSMPAGGWILDSAGKTWAKPLTILCTTGTYKLSSDIICTSTLFVQGGTFDFNDKNATLNTFSSSSITTRVLYLGSGTIEVTGIGTSLTFANPSGLTLYPETSTIKMTNNSVDNKGFSTGGVTLNNFWNATQGTGILTLTGSGVFSDFKIDAGREVNFTQSTNITVTTFTALGTAGSHIVIHSTTATHATLTKAGGGLISGCDYIDASYLTGSPANTWYIGSNSTDAVGSSLTNIYLLDEPAATANAIFFGCNV
jgi:hypothetical protein